MENKYKKKLEELLGPAAVTLDSPEYLEAKRRLADHFQDCTLCGDDKKCPEGKTLFENYWKAIEASIRNAGQ